MLFTLIQFDIDKEKKLIIQEIESGLKKKKTQREREKKNNSTQNTQEAILYF